MEHTDDLDVHTIARRRGIDAIEDRVGVDGSRAQAAAKVGHQVAADAVHPGIEDETVERELDFIEQLVGAFGRDYSGEISPDLYQVPLCRGDQVN